MKAQPPKKPDHCSVCQHIPKLTRTVPDEYYPHLYFCRKCGRPLPSPREQARALQKAAVTNNDDPPADRTPDNRVDRETTRKSKRKSRNQHKTVVKT
jgi:hypothetical protein